MSKETIISAEHEEKKAEIQSEQSLVDKLTEEVQKAVAAEKQLGAGKVNLSAGNIRYLPETELRKLLTGGELADGKELIKLGSGRQLLDHSEKCWHQYKDHHYARDLIGDNFGLVGIYKDILEAELRHYCSRDSKAHQEARENNPDAKHAESEIVKLLKKKLGNLSNLNYAKRILEYATQGRGSLGIEGTEWDLNPHLIGFSNGVLDTRTGEFRAGRPDDYIRDPIPHPWLGWDCRAPVFEKFLAEILPLDPADPTKGGDLEVISYLQRLFGSPMGGVVSERVIVLLLGHGQNGKGTLMEILAFALGVLAGPVQSEMLLDQTYTRSSAGPSPDLMSLRGKRMVWASENNEGRKMDSGRVKFLTGGDTIKARVPFGRYEVTFLPTYLLLLLTNHAPEVDPDDKALWYRLRLIQFRLSFVEKPSEPHERTKDSELMAKLKAEVSGILAWVMRGYRDYKADGINTPAKVLLDTGKYREDNDILSQFISECLVQDKTGSVGADKLFTVYRKWAEDSRLKPLTRPVFGVKIKKRLAFGRDRKRGWYLGYKLPDKGE